MAKSEVLVRMKADTQGYDANIAKARRQLDGFKKDNLSAGGAVKQLTSNLIATASKFASFGAATAAAMKVAKDAFMASEAAVDEWGKMIKSAEGVYEGFLNAINNGDISGYLSRIDEIVSAARQAYDELDKLGTMKTIQSPQFAKQESENNRIRTMLMTGRWISAADGRKSPLGLKDGDLLSPQMIRTLEKQLQGGMNKIVSLTKNEIGQTGKAIDAYYNSLAKQNGMTLAEFRQGTSSWGAFSEKMAGYEAYKKWNTQAQSEFARQGGRGYVNFDKNNPYAEFRRWGTFRVDKMGENSYNDLVNLIKQQQGQQSQMYSTMGQAYRTVNRAEGVTVKGLLGGGKSGVNGGSGKTEKTEEQLINDNIQKLTQEYIKASNDRQAAIRDEIKGLQDQLAVIRQLKDEALGKTTMPIVGMRGLADSPVGISTENPFEKYKDASFELVTPLQQLEKELLTIQDLQAKAWSPEVFAAYQKRVEEVQGKIDTFKGIKKDADTSAKSFNDAAQSIASVGSALQSLEDPGAKIAGIIGEAVARIALGFAQATAAASGGGPLAWFAAITGGLATMVSTIQAIHSATGYAHGGIVDGNSYSGDNIPIMANAGEVVLTRSMTNNLASQLQGVGLQNLHLSATVSGTQLRFVLNNESQSRGRGMYVTTNFNG